MKSSKTLRVLLFTVLALFTFIPARAQQSGLQPALLAGGTASQAAQTTNQMVTAGMTNQAGSLTSDTITTTNISINVADYDNVGLTFQETGTTQSTNGIYGLRVYRSYNKGVTYEANPGWSFTNMTAAPGAQTFTVVTNLYIPSVTTLAFSFENGNTNILGFETNILLQINCKDPRVKAALTAY